MLEIVSATRYVSLMENVVGNTKHQNNSSDKNANHKYKDIEEAIQKAIKTESSKQQNHSDVKKYNTAK